MKVAWISELVGHGLGITSAHGAGHSLREVVQREPGHSRLRCPPELEVLSWSIDTNRRPTTSKRVWRRCG